METEIYKMIYITKIDKKLNNEIDNSNQNNKEIMKNENIRILGYNFVKNNINKAHLIINNKKFNLKEYINNQEIKKDIIKIKMILNKGLSNRSYMFENCKELKEFTIYDNIIKSEDEIGESNEKEIFYEYGTDYKKDNNYNNDNNNLYKNTRNGDIYLIDDEISNITKKTENQDISTLIYLKNKSNFLITLLNHPLRTERGLFSDARLYGELKSKKEFYDIQIQLY